MSLNLRRIAAVAAALTSIRNRVSREDTKSNWSTEPYNNAITLLEGAVDTDTDHLTLCDDTLPGRDFLVHLDSTIAFLEGYADMEHDGQDDDDDDDDHDGVLEDDDDDLDISEDDEDGDDDDEDEYESETGSAKPKGSTILGFPRRK